MKCLLFFSCLILSFCAPAKAQLAYKKSFEITDQNSAQTWEFLDMSGKYTTSWVTSRKHSGKYALLIDGQNTTHVANDNMGHLLVKDISTAMLTSKKKIRLEGWIKTDTHQLHAFIWMAANLLNTGIMPQDEGFADTLTTKPSWQHVQVEKLLDTAIQAIYYGGVVNGKGKAWFNDIQLFIDEQHGYDRKLFSRASATNFILPLQKDTASKASAWLGKPLNFRTIGFMKDDHQFSTEVLRKNFDAVIL